MIPETMGYTFVGGPKHGQTVSGPVPDGGAKAYSVREPVPERPGFVRYGHYRTRSASDEATGVLRWGGWEPEERPLPTEAERPA